MTRIEEIEARLAAIAEEAEKDGANIDELTEEVRNLKKEKSEIEKVAEKRAKLRQDVAGGMGTVVRKFEAEKEDRVFGVDTEEYRTAWLKNLQGKDLTAMEQRAFTVANGAISSLVANDIVTVVRDHAPLLDRISMVYSAAKITYYVEGTTNAAADHTENAAITPAADTLTSVTLTPSEIVKMIQVSDAAQQMSIPVFNAWLTRTLGEAIARKINADIISAMSTAATSQGTTITAATVQSLLGSVKGERIAVLCNRETLYTALLPLQDNSKNNIVRFDGTYSTASVYGVEILVDDNVADKTIIAGDMTKAVAAMAEGVTVRQAYDIDTNSYKYLGVALFDVAIAINSAFSKLVVSD